jgi:hypothetical protein
MKTLIEQRLLEALEKAQRQLDSKNKVDVTTMDVVEAWNSLLQAKRDAQRANEAKVVK